jgi:hypothetical protein
VSASTLSAEDIANAEGRQMTAWHWTRRHAAAGAAGGDHDPQKDALLDTISQRLTQHLEHEPLFTLHWQLV